MQVIGKRHSENESSRFRSRNHIYLLVFNQSLQRVDRLAETVRVLKNRRDVPETLRLALENPEWL